MIENRIRELRTKQGLTQVELARRAKIASPNLSNIERGVLAPWEKAKRAIARGLKVTVEEVFPPEAVKSDGMCSYCGSTGDLIMAGTVHVGGRGEVMTYACKDQARCFSQRHENVRRGREPWDTGKEVKENKAPALKE